MRSTPDTVTARCIISTICGPMQKQGDERQLMHTAFLLEYRF